MSPTGPGERTPPASPEFVLGIAPGATQRQIETAWRAYVKQHHPDRGGDAEAFLRGRAARDVLLGSPGSGPTNPVTVTVRGQPSRRRLMVRRVRRSLGTIFPSLAPPPSRVD